VPGAERVRFANTGTEAAMHALMAARAKTGRERIAKPEGGYHGWYDFVFVSAWGAPDRLGPAENPAAPPGSAGLSAHAAETVVVPFNDLAATERILRAHQDELAAFILEPTLIDIGYIPADPAYLAGVRAITKELGIVLIFDELLTGFRLPGHSAAAFYDIEPDLALYGKAIANGHIVAALAGRTELFELPHPPAYVGTFNSHAVSMAAVSATLAALADGQVLARLDTLTEQLGQGINRLGERYGIPVRFQGRGGHFHVYFSSTSVVDYRSAQAASAERYDILARQLRADRILIAGRYLLHSALSYAHTEADIEHILDSAERAFQQMT
jgi:glutamate-1-semialdehyde 2,1-aminomutase